MISLRSEVHNLPPEQSNLTHLFPKPKPQLLTMAPLILEPIDPAIRTDQIESEECLFTYYYIPSRIPPSIQPDPSRFATTKSIFPYPSDPRPPTPERGQLVTFIPGGNGHGRQYFPLMLYLSEVLPGYTYATYDRRQMSLSQPISLSPKVPGVKRKFSHPQQARDTLAIIQALNFDTSIIFGSSLGGIIAYQLALDHPSAVTSLIIHEAPTFSLLPDASKIYDGFRGMHEDFEDGKDVARAWRRFNKFFIGLGDDKDKKEKEVEGMREVSSPEVENEVNFWENEFLSAFWTPDLRRLRGLAAPKNSRKGSVFGSEVFEGLIVEGRDGNPSIVVGGANPKRVGGKVVIMRGERSGEAFYARACVEQAEVLGMGNGITGPRDGVMIVPGHHQGFEAEVEAFAPVFLDVLSGFELAEEEEDDEEEKEEVIPEPEIVKVLSVETSQEYENPPQFEVNEKCEKLGKREKLEKKSLQWTSRMSRLFVA